MWIFACLSGHLSNLSSSLMFSNFLFKYEDMSTETYPATLLPFYDKSVTVNKHFFSLNWLSWKYMFELISNSSLKLATLTFKSDSLLSNFYFPLFHAT